MAVQTLEGIELVMWSPENGAEPPMVSAVREALTNAGLNPERAEGIAVTTAFRRAVKALETEKSRAVIWDVDHTLYGILEEVVPDGESLRRTEVNRWKMFADVIVGDRDVLRADYHRACYTWADVSVAIQRILKKDALGAYSPRRSGGIYFVPSADKTITERLERAMSTIGLRFLRYEVPDTESQRNEVREAICDNLSRDLKDHEDAIAAYTGDTMELTVNNRREKLAEFESMIRSLSAHLNGRGVELLARVRGLDARCVEVIAEIARQRTMGRARGGRSLSFSS